MNVLTGPIQPVQKTLARDRSEVAYTLWEQSTRPNPVDLPWRPAASYDESEVRALVSSAGTVAAAGLRPDTLGHIVSGLKPGARAYWYGSASLESGPALAQALARTSDRLAVRLGHELPADWIVVDGGRTGVVFIGPPGDRRRWAVPLEAALARSLFEVFRVLWWQHARREGLPDSAGTFAFRPPLPSPFADPGRSLALPAGRFAFDQALPDPVPDAEFRVVPDGGTPGRGGIVLMPPSTASFDVARRVANGGARVVWSDCGLPRTTVSRQRLVMDLVQGPVGIQLEWETGTAVDVYHRLGKACEAPAWTFHSERRLRDIAGPAWLEGAGAAAPVRGDQRIELGELRASLAEFETAAPLQLPEPAPLARQVVYGWQTVPESVPPGAAKAQIVRQWTALDEWTTRGVAVLQQRLSGMEGEERSFLSRLKGWLRGQDAVQRERDRLRDALAEIGEQPPSQRNDARETVSRLVEEAGRLQGLIQQAHRDRQDAEDRADEDVQRSAWEVRVTAATTDLNARRQDLAALDEREAEADAEVRGAEAALANRTSELRSSRSAGLAEARDRDDRALAGARAQLKELDAKHRGNAPKDERKGFTSEIGRLEQQVAAAKRDLAAMDKWAPSPAELADHNAALRRAREAKESIRKVRAPLTAEIAKLDRAAKEEFQFRAGVRLSAVSIPDLGAAPTVPAEAPPEIGELFEHQGQRYLAVRTWEQVQRAPRVAARLRASMVAFPPSSK